MFSEGLTDTEIPSVHERRARNSGLSSQVCGQARGWMTSVKTQSGDTNILLREKKDRKGWDDGTSSHRTGEEEAV